jgi:hypothetical protein
MLVKSQNKIDFHQMILIKISKIHELINSSFLLRHLPVNIPSIYLVNVIDNIQVRTILQVLSIDADDLISDFQLRIIGRGP